MPSTGRFHREFRHGEPRHGHDKVVSIRQNSRRQLLVVGGLRILQDGDVIGIEQVLHASSESSGRSDFRNSFHIAPHLQTLGNPP